MSFRINTNIEAMVAQRNLSLTGSLFAREVERLSSGLRINRAGDDAAGLSISQKLDAQVRGLNQASRNAQDGISMIQTAEGALQEVHAMLQRMRELAVQAANDTLSSEDRVAINSELQQLREEIDAISGRTQFNGKYLLTGDLATTLDGLTTAGVGFVVAAATNTSVTKVDVSGAAAGTTYTFADTGTGLSLSDGTTTQEIAYANLAVAADGSVVLNYDQLGIKVTISSVAGETGANVAAGLDTQTIVTAAANSNANFQIGPNSSDQFSVSFAQVDISSLNLTTALDNFNTTQSVANAQALITALDSAINDVSSNRSVLGAAQNRLEHTIANLNVAAENLAASASRIRDADIAAETVNFTKVQILQQAGMAVLAQANAAPQSVLTLLR